MSYEEITCMLALLEQSVCVPDLTKCRHTKNLFDLRILFVASHQLFRHLNNSSSISICLSTH